VRVNTLAALTAEVLRFRDARDWSQFHNAKDVALSLALEAAEVLELFQWKTDPESIAAAAKQPALAEELADVLYWTLLMAHDHKVDLSHALVEKLRQNDAKYPVEKAKGLAKKYTEL
jgi:dCTP diphosphatase